MNRGAFVIRSLRQTEQAKANHMAFETIIVEIEDHLALIKLNRPDALNALNQQLLSELCTALEEADQNDKVRCIIGTP